MELPELTSSRASPAPTELCRIQNCVRHQTVGAGLALEAFGGLRELAHKLDLLPMRRLLHHRRQPDLGPRQALRQPRQRQWRQRPQAWITTNGLPVVEQYDRLPIRRHLDRPQGNTLGNHRLALVLQLRPQQPNSHAIGTTVQSPDTVERIEQALPAELTDLR